MDTDSPSVSPGLVESPMLPPAVRQQAKPKKKKPMENSWVAATKLKIFGIILYYVVIVPFQWLKVFFTRYTDKSLLKRTEKRYLGILASTEDYLTWTETATSLDKLRGFEKWRHEKPQEDYCDAEAIVVETMVIRRLLKLGNRRAAAEFVRTHLHRKGHGLANPMLYRYYRGTKRFVEEYNKEVCNLIRFVANPEGAELQLPSNSASTTQTPRLAPPVGTAFMDESEGCMLRDKVGHDVHPLKLSQYTKSILEWAEEHADEGDMSVPDVCEVLEDTYRSYGSCALMLSGGASLGVYHTGVIRALWDAQLLPKIISGSSAGAIIASIFCTRTDEEVNEILADKTLGLGSVSLDAFGESTISTKLERLAQSGAFMDVTTLMEMLRKNCGDMTFQEAYEKSGRILNVSVAAENREGDKEMLLNYVTAPDVVVWSAVSASCAMPGLFTSVQLMRKSVDSKGKERLLPYLEGQLWYDGSVACDLPRKELSTLFNVNYFIVSQTNPHVIPFLKKDPSPLVHKKRSSWSKRLWFAACSEMKYWLLKLFRFGLLPTTGGAEVPYLLSIQNYSGDLTILPIGSVWRAIPDFVNLTSNPSQEHMQYVVSNAQRRTWPHINQIRCVTEVERELEAELTALRAKLKKSPNGGEEQQ